MRALGREAEGSGKSHDQGEPTLNPTLGVYNVLRRASETTRGSMAPLPKGQDLEVQDKNMKKILAFAMVLGVIGSIVGCGSSDSSAPADSTTTPASSAATPPAGGGAMKSDE